MPHLVKTIIEAEKTIASLRAENARLREALEKLIEWAETQAQDAYDEQFIVRARAALGVAGEEK